MIYAVGGIAAFAVFWLIARRIRNLVQKALIREHVSADAVVLATRVIYFALLVMGAFIALGVAFRSENVTVAGVIGATVVASLGVQDILRNYVSGFYILFERNIKVGDTIEFGGKTGIVTDVRMRVTYLSGENGDLVVVPNAELFNTTVTVRSREEPPPAQTAPVTPRRRAARSAPGR